VAVLLGIGSLSCIYTTLPQSLETLEVFFTRWQFSRLADRDQIRLVFPWPWLIEEYLVAETDKLRRVLGKLEVVGVTFGVDDEKEFEFNESFVNGLE